MQLTTQWADGRRRAGQPLAPGAGAAGSWPRARGQFRSVVHLAPYVPRSVPKTNHS